MEEDYKKYRQEQLFNLKGGILSSMVGFSLCYLIEIRFNIFNQNYIGFTRQRTATIPLVTCLAATGGTMKYFEFQYIKNRELANKCLKLYFFLLRAFACWSITETMFFGWNGSECFKELRPFH